MPRSTDATTRPEHVAVVGAGIAGMFSALELAQQGIRVTLFERDVPPPQGDAEQAFFAWQRRGAAQFRHPHAFLGLMCSIIEEHRPQLLQAFLHAGARRMNFVDTLPPNLRKDYRPEPGDEKLWILLCRRATLETVLRRYVESFGNIELCNTTYVTGVQTKLRDGQLRVTSLQLTDRARGNAHSEFTADAYIDAAGRASKFRQWLNESGTTITEQRDDAEIVYYTRHYKLNPGIDEPNRHEHEPFAGDLGYLKYGVFPGDGGHFAIIMCVPNGEAQLRAAIKDGDKFDGVCRQIPGLLPWVGPGQSSPTTPPFGIGQIHAVWRDFVSEGAIQAVNYFAVGDAAARTNPLYGRGCSIGILQAHLLAEVLSSDCTPEQRARRYQQLSDERIKPIFDASLREDKNGIKRADAVMRGADRDKASGLKSWLGLAFGDALAAAVQANIHAFRGMMRTVNLVENPGDFLQDPKIKRTVFLYMLRGRKRNARSRVRRGPGRSDMLEFIATL